MACLMKPSEPAPSSTGPRNFVQFLPDGLQVLDKSLVVAVPLLRVGRTKNGGRMNGSGDARGHRMLEEMAAFLEDPVLLSQPAPPSRPDKQSSAGECVRVPPKAKACKRQSRNRKASYESAAYRAPRT